MMTTSVATLLRTWRERALLTQEQLAERSGLSVRTIRRLEHGLPARPRFSSLSQVAGALRLDALEEAQLAATARGTQVTKPATTATAGGGQGTEPGVSGVRGAEAGVSGGQGSERAVSGGQGNGSWVIVPRQLPLGAAHFVGRDDELSALDGVLTDDRQTAPRLLVVVGCAGVGKSALAVHWARRVAGRFPDGQLYANLRGFEASQEPLDPAEAIGGFLHALGVPPQLVPADPAAQAALLRSTLNGRRILIVLDNARDAVQVRPLLPGSGGCLAIVTSRDQLSGLVTAGAAPLVLDPMRPADARLLLAGRLGAARVTAEPEAVGEIAAACSGLPLALSIAAARAATHPGFPLDALAEELRADRLDALSGEGAFADVRTVFSWSYRTLSSGAARMFRLLGMQQGADFSLRSAACAAALPVRRARALLAELTRAHLVAERSPGQYAQHDLLRAYAAELAARAGIVRPYGRDG